LDSPRLAALAKALDAGDADALDRFWREMQGKAPLVEPIPGDPHASWLTVVWRGDADTRRAAVQGGPATGDFAAAMRRLGDTDLWYRTDRIPNDARYAYFIQVNRPFRFPAHSERLPPIAPPHADPLNPRKAQEPDRSLVEMPDAPAQPWLKRTPGVPKGELHDHKFKSKSLASTRPALETQRRVTMYTPANFDPKGSPCGLLPMFDGGRPRDDQDLPVALILDNLIAQKKVPPLVVAFIHQTRDRDREVGCSEPFAAFVATELVPTLRERYHVSPDPARTIVAGMSGGGLMAAYCAFRYPGAFGNVLSLSGGFGFWPGSLDERMDEEPGWLTRRFRDEPRVPVRFFLAAGTFENWFFPYSLLAENRRLRDVLLARGYRVDYQEFTGGHHPVSWRGPFVGGLIALTTEANDEP
jgi:enterochelin esterase family protein